MIKNLAFWHSKTINGLGGVWAGIAVEARYGAGFKALAAEFAGDALGSVIYAVGSATSDALVYKMTNGKMGKPIGDNEIFSSVGLDMAFGLGFMMLGGIGSYARGIWKVPTEANPSSYEFVMPSAQHVDAEFQNTSADTTAGGMNPSIAGGSFVSAVPKTLNQRINFPKPHSMTSTEATDWLLSMRNELVEYDKILKDQMLSRREHAFRLVQMRNTFVFAARVAIADTRVSIKLNIDRPLWDFNEQVDVLRGGDKGLADGLSGSKLYDQLIDDVLDEKQLQLEIKHVQCFPAGTMVHTDKGLVPIQDIKVGDMVLSRPEWGGENAPTEYKRVVRAFCAGEAEVIRLVCQRKSEYDQFKTPIYVQFLTPNHPIWVERLDEWVSARDLYIGEQISGINQDDPLLVLSIDSVYKASLSSTHHLGICREPSYGDEYKNDVDMYIDFHQDGYKVSYNRFTSNYVFDRDVYYDYDYDIEKIIFESFDEDPSSLLETLVYNIEVEEFHTYFVGQERIWVHNANCNYQYVPNLTKTNSPLPDTVSVRDLQRSDTLPNYVVWMPTDKNIKEAFDSAPSEGGIFVTPDIYRTSETVEALKRAGRFERNVWGARFDSSVGANQSHFEYGVVFENPEFKFKPNVHNWRQYEGAKVLPNGKIQVIDRKLYSWADEVRQYMKKQNGSPVGPYPINKAVSGLLRTMYNDVLALKANPNILDSVAYSFHMQSSVDVFNKELRDKIVQDGFGGLKLDDVIDKKSGAVIVSGNDMLLAIQNAFRSGKILGVFDTVNYQLVEHESEQTTVDTLNHASIESLIPAARQYWLDAGASAQVLDQIQFHIGDLDDRVAAITQGAQVTLDRTGAGWGWFIDSTPQEHSEFVQSATLGMDASADSPAHGKLDLLTVLIHEMGHVLGIDPKIADDVMTQVLDTGERRLPSALDAMLLQYNASNRVAQTGQHVLQAKAWSPVASQATLNNAAWLDNGTDWLTQGEIIYNGNRVTLQETTQTHTRLAQAFQVNTGDRGLQFTLDQSTLSRLTGQPNDAFEVALLNANTSKAIC